MRRALSVLTILAAAAVLSRHTAIAPVAFAQPGIGAPGPSGPGILPTLTLGGGTIGTANRLSIIDTDAMAAVLDWTPVRVQSAPVTVTNTGVAFGIYSTMTNNTSTVGTTGHMVGGMLNITDNSAGRFTTYGGELRNDCKSTDAAATHSCIGGSARSIFSGSSISASLLVIGLEAFANITTDGSTPLASGTAASIYLPTIVGGTNKYAIYAVSDTIFAGGGISTAGASIASSGLFNELKGGNVSSAGTITITGNLFHVTGTTTITSVSGTSVPSGTVITIIFDGALTFTDGSNLKLNGNFVTTADDTITLKYDGTNWYELGRSAN